MSSPGYTQNVLYPELPGVTGEIVPLNRDPQGQLHLAVPGFVHDVVNAGYNALAGPSEIASGRNPFTGQEAHPNPLGVAGDITGMMLGAGGLVSAPENAMLSFGGKFAQTSDWAQRAAAVAAEKAGSTPEEIWNKTGWFRDVDQNWKYEISNTGSKLSPEMQGIANPYAYLARQQARGKDHVLSDVFDDPELFAAYPWLKKIPVEIQPSGAATWSPDTKTIGIGPSRSQNLPDFVTAILHEAQHGIQDYEGFAQGQHWNQYPDEPSLQIEISELSKVEYTKRRTAMDAAARAGYDPNAVIDGLDSQSSKDFFKLFYESDRRDPAEIAALNHPVMQLPESQEALEATKALAQLWSDPRSQMYKYARSAGETEARNVEERWLQGLGPETPPWKTEGYWTAMQELRFPPQWNVGSRAELGSQAAQPHEFAPTEENPFNFSLEPIEHNPFGAKQ